jgi:hypothetical protein
VNVGTRFRGADPEQIVYELQLARLQTDELFETGNRLEAVAFFHLRFERIHPNSRTSLMSPAYWSRIHTLYKWVHFVHSPNPPALFMRVSGASVRANYR